MEGLGTNREVTMLILAVVLTLTAVLFVVASSAPRVQTTSFTLQPTANYCTFHPFDIATSGSIRITYSASPGPVLQLVMTEVQEQSFFSGSYIGALGDDFGSQSTFTTALPTGGRYYVVSCHSAAYQTILQTGQHTMTITGLDPGPLYVGIALLAIALSLVIVSLILGAKARRSPRVPGFPARPYPPGLPWIQNPAGWPSPAAPGTPIVLRTLHVRLENASAADEAIGISLNGTPLATVPLPAGRTAEVDLHPNMTAPIGGILRLDVLSRGGSRAARDVAPDATGRVEVTLRLG